MSTRSKLTELETNKPKSYSQSQKVTNAYNYLTQMQNNKPKDYSKSQEVLDAEALLKEYQNKKPGEYQKSEEVLAAEKLLKDYEANKPGDYQSSYKDQIDGLLDSIMNRKDFSYDFSSDPLYQQYAEQYKRQANTAMQNVMGNAATLTGGYGNSYAATAGNLAYQNSMQGINDIIPDLYNSAYNAYNQKGQDMYNQVNLLQGMDEQDYAKYRDTVADYYTNLDYYKDSANTAYNRDYGKYRDTVSDYYNDIDFYSQLADKAYQRDYGEYRDKVSDYHTDLEFANNRYTQEYNWDYGAYRDNVSDYNTQLDYWYSKYADEIEQANWEREFGLQQEQFAYQQQRDAADRALQYAQLNARNSSGSGSSKSSSKGSSSKGSSSNVKYNFAPLSDSAANKYKTNVKNMAPAQAKNYISNLYSSGKISQTTANSLMNYSVDNVLKSNDKKNLFLYM